MCERSKTCAKRLVRKVFCAKCPVEMSTFFIWCFLQVPLASCLHKPNSSFFPFLHICHIYLTVALVNKYLRCNVIFVYNASLASRMHFYVNTSFSNRNKDIWQWICQVHFHEKSTGLFLSTKKLLIDPAANVYIR